MIFYYSAALRFSDTDAMGHVNHARFLTYLEDARVAFLAAQVGNRGGFMDRGIIVARIEIDYLRPLSVEDLPVQVSVAVSGVGRTSFTLGYRIEQRGEVAACASSVMVAYDYASASTRPLDDDERAALTASANRR